jgi:hypothetical protein
MCALPGRSPEVASNISRFWRWIKGLAEAIWTPQTIEMTVRTDRIVIIRRRLSRRVWCQQCGREVDAVAVHEATSLTGAEQLALPGNSESAWHVCIGNDGETLICLDSLLKTG